MAANAPTTQILSDQNGLVTVKVTGFYNATTTSNNKIIQANTLAGANTSRACIISLVDIEYDITIPNGFLSVQYQGSAANADAVILGGDCANKMKYYIPNPFAGGANNVVGFGDINLLVSNAASEGCYTLLMTFTKEGDAGGGFANSFTQGAGFVSG